MTSAGGDDRPPIRVVLADANVLYSRVLRDYLLYAATQGVLEIRWSGDPRRGGRAPDGEHRRVRRGGRRAVDQGDERRLPGGRGGTDAGAIEAVAELSPPDEDDRHVLAAAVAVEADVLCTDNLKDFPTDTMDEAGIRLMSADALLSLLVIKFPDQMLAAHRLTVSRLPGATDESTLAALRRAGVRGTANIVRRLLVRARR